MVIFDNQGNRETHMRVAVIGSRAPSTESKKRVVAYLDKIKKDINMIVTGGAFGMDSVGMIYAVNNKIPLTVFEPIGYHNTELCGIYRKLPNCNISATLANFILSLSFKFLYLPMLI